MFDADRLLIVSGVALLVLAFSSRIVKRFALSPVLLALVAGALVGHDGFDLLDPRAVIGRTVLLEQLARVALALAVFDIALRTRVDDLRANAARIAVLLLVVMPGMWLITAAGASWIFGLPFALALVIGAVLTPTDPGVAAALVTGVLPNRSLPRRVRMTLQLEAAANDGLALPFVLFASLASTLPVGEATEVFAGRIAKELGVAIVVGLAVGALLHVTTEVVGADRLAEEDWFPLAGPATAIAVLGIAHVLGGTGVLAAFLAGIVFSEKLPEPQREPIHTVHRSLVKVTLTAVFVAFGAVLPFRQWWPELGAAGIAFALWCLAVRRPPVAFPALVATRTGPLSSAFIGWSGPLGVAGIYYLAYIERLAVPEYERIFTIASLAIAGSVLGHALTSAALVRVYRHRSGEEVEEGEELELEGSLP